MASLWSEPCKSSARCLTPEQLLLPAPEKTACQIRIIRDDIILLKVYVFWMSSGGLYDLMLSTVSCCFGTHKEIKTGSQTGHVNGVNC